MITRAFAVAVMLIGVNQVILAEGTAPDTSSTSTTSSSHDSLPQELRQKLQQAGYKNIEIVPGSYLVNAQDAQGNNVMMRIGPTSMTVLTEASANSSSSPTTGSGDNSGQNQSGANPSTSPPSTGSSNPDSTK
jgi:hypothetical protein